jgi:hypothetical protein
LKPLEFILPNDDSVVRDKAIASLKIVGDNISEETLYGDYLTLINKMRKGELFS